MSSNPHPVSVLKRTTSALLATFFLFVGSPAWAQAFGFGEAMPLADYSPTDLGFEQEPHIVTDGQGRWLVVNVRGVPDDDPTRYDRDIELSRSFDDGATWSSPTIINSNFEDDGVEDRSPRMATDGAGTWIVVWYHDDPPDDNPNQDADLLFVRSTDHGETWTDPAPLNTNADTDVGDDELPQIATDGAGNWVVVWESRDELGAGLGVDSDIFCARSSDNGATWTDPAPVNSNAAGPNKGDQEPDIATDGAGTWIVAWSSTNDLSDTLGNDDDIVFARSTDAGASWTEPAPLNSNAATDDGDDQFPKIATDRAGNWVVVWESLDQLGDTIGRDRDLFVANSTDNGQTWSEFTVLNDTAAFDGSFPDEEVEVVSSGAGAWLAVWTAAGPLTGSPGFDRDICISVSTNNGVSWSATHMLNSNGWTDNRQDLYASVATDREGKWVAVWTSDDSLGGSIWNDWDLLFARSSLVTLDSGAVVVR